MDCGKNADNLDYMVRPRINGLLAETVKKPLTVVCAGAGYGKTRAVSDFVNASDFTTIWVRLSERDNSESRFWENYTKAISRADNSLIEDVCELGFPNTNEKLKQYLHEQNRSVPNQNYILVFDDVHLINAPSVLAFLEYLVHNVPANISIILICREMPQIYIENLRSKNLVSYLNEENLKFTQNELEEYMQSHNISDLPTVYEIFQDAKGWALSVNLIAGSLKKSPGDSRYIRSAVKQSIMKMMDMEVWRPASKKLKRLWVKISLADHFSASLINTLAHNDENLLTELRQASAYIRFDNYMGVYLINHLFLEFLRTKQDILSEDEKRDAYKVAADWCRQNGFLTEAIAYYEKFTAIS